MSIALNDSPAPASRWIRSLADWLRQARVAASMPPRELDAGSLQHRHLADIGLERTAIARAACRDVERLGLLDLGWQHPCPPPRRR